MTFTQLLTTKLYPPPPRPNLVARQRLIERLNAGLQTGRQLILVSASAGFGKTTLASEWRDESRLERSMAWISLDESDNDPARFLFYLVAAVRQVDPGIGEDLIPVLQASQPSPSTELVFQWINQIAASEKNILLVLDDYHQITSEAVHQIVQLIIARQPNRMHTVILTREDPPFPLPRMRVRGQIIEIRERDLRFTLPEAQAFLVEAMSIDLSAEDVEVLKERTEGWVAGMQLAALALEDYTDSDGRRVFIHDFAGSDRFIVDYLVSEVLERQPEAVRQFLLDTSILGRFCGELCDEIIENREPKVENRQEESQRLSMAYPPGQAVLDSRFSTASSILTYLDHSNLFLVPLDNQRHWYRYHHLFAEMLSHFLRRAAPDRIPELHRRASEWFEEKGFTPEAFSHALEAGDRDLVTALLDRHAMRLLTQGQLNLVIGWCQALPKEYLIKAPEICIYFAWALVLTFRNDYLDAVEEKLQLAERGIHEPGLPAQAHVGPMGSLVPFRDWVTGQVCVVRSQLLLARFNTFVDPQEMISLSLKGLELLPEAEKPIRSTCWINLAIAHLIKNDPVAADKAFDAALPYMVEANNYLGVVTGVIYKARLAYYQGQLEQAEELCQQWKARFAAMSEHPERDIPAVRGLDIMLAILFLERGRVEEAHGLLAQALEFLGWASWEELLGFVTLARLRYLGGDLAGVEETVRRMSNMGPQHAACAEALQVYFECQTSLDDPLRRSRAEVWALKHSPNLDILIIPLGIGPYHCDVEYITALAWAHVQIALGNPRAALDYLEPALQTARESQLTLRIVELTIAVALSHAALGDHPAALDHLNEALDTARPYGYIQVFAEGPVLERMLRKISAQNIHPGYVERILASIPRSAAGEMASGGSRLPAPSQPRLTAYPALVEPLSERELEVLRLIAAGYSNLQIAKQLFIAEGTVKRHITNLYGKLDVQTRTQAIVKARELGLIA